MCGKDTVPVVLCTDDLTVPSFSCTWAHTCIDAADF